MYRFPLSSLFLLVMACGPGIPNAPEDPAPLRDSGVPDDGGIPGEDGGTGDGDAGTAWDAGAGVDAGAAEDGGPAVNCVPYAGDFYAVDAGAALPGEVVRCAPAELEDGGTRFPGRRTWRVAYGTTTLVHTDAGSVERPIIASGLVVIPEGVPLENRPVLANTHGTSGLLRQCAPSAWAALDARVVFQDLASAAPEAVVVVPDFPGLGVDVGLRSAEAHRSVVDPLAPWRRIEPLRDIAHPYLSIEGEGRATIDLVRAARWLPGAGTGISPRWVALGVSQGGHAALATGEVWSRGYGAETSLRGVLAGAPGSALEDSTWVIPEVERLLTPMVLAGLSLEYRDLSPFQFLSTQALAGFGQTVGRGCLSGSIVTTWATVMGAYLAPNHPLLRADPLLDPVARRALRENSPGHQPTLVPIFIGQTTGDPFVDHRRTARLVELERQTNPGRVTACVYEGRNLAAPWTQRAANHDTFSFMFGAANGVCTGPSGQPTTASASDFVATSLAP
ncbi:MAG: hypothetical protein AB1938_26800 [Myxococcota bacterium]